MPLAVEHRPVASLPRLFRLPALAVVAAAFAAIVLFLFMGNPSGHDFEFHMYSWMEVVHQWKEGILYPRWASFAHWTYGEARFLFYPPASWTLGALLGAVLPWRMASGAYVWCALTACGVSMFLLARRWLDPQNTLFAAILYALNPYHLVVIYWRSALAELFAACLLPLLLLFVLRCKEKGHQMILPLSAVVAAAWLTNVPAAVMVNYSLALLVVTVAIRWRKPRLLLYAAAAVLLGAALAAFYLVPAAYEESWVNLGEVLAPGVCPADNFLFTPTADADHNRFNLLISIVATAEILIVGAAIWLFRRRREQPTVLSWTLTVWAGVAALLTCSLTRVFWAILPELRFVQFPWRWLLCLNVAFALFVTMVFRRWQMRLALYLAMLCLLSILWHRVQQPWWDAAADLQEMRDAIDDRVGYEGTDEYVPAGVDPYQLNRDAPQIAVISRRPAHLRILAWRAQLKRFTVEVTHPEKLRLRLLNYPAWQIEVNGVAINAKSQPVTGEILVPVEAGISEVRVTFVRTSDRLLGGIITIIAALLVTAWMLYQKRQSLTIPRRN